MRYLFFDIECCNGRDICEFGYVVTDVNFNILEKKDITINPKRNFNLVGRPDGRDLYLYYTESEYYSSPEFAFYYDEIKKLIEEPNQLIVGHSIKNDAIFIRTACQRYKLGPINFKFADSQKMFSEFSSMRKNISLEDAGDKFNIEKPKYLHKSDEDSELTMNLVKSMCKQLDCSLEELIDLCDSCSGKSENFAINYDDYEIKQQKRYDNAKNDPNNFIKKRNYKLFFQFLDGVKPQGEIIESPLNGKSLCISLNYEYSHFREMLAIIQLLANRGCEYRLKASLNDIFVKYPKYKEDGSEMYCSRLNYTEQAISQDNKQIEIITFNELLKLLDTTEEQLSSFPFPNKDSFFVKKKSSNNNSTKETKHKRETTTIGALFGDLLEQIKIERRK